MPVNHIVAANYPNPFNPSTVIQFFLPEHNRVTLEIFDMTGRLIATLIDGELSAGQQQVVWDAAEITSGVYVYRITAGSLSSARKMLLVR